MSFWIDTASPLQLAIASRPQGGEWLEEDVRKLKDEGIDILVSLLSWEESRELDLEEEKAVCSSVGMAFVNFALPDRYEEHTRCTHHALNSRRWIVAPNKSSIQFAFRDGLHDIAFGHCLLINGNAHALQHHPGCEFGGVAVAAKKHSLTVNVGQRLNTGCPPGNQMQRASIQHGDPAQPRLRSR